MEKKALVRNAGDPEQVKGARETEKRRREREARELAELLDDPKFRRFCWRLLGYCHVASEPLDRELIDVGRTQGKRTIGLNVVAWIAEANADAYPRMQREAYEAERQMIEPQPRSEEPIEDA